jgi:2-(1,2-epoxy-1,2-dihydrophenyl)acetyl-CoA isomerase
MIIFRLDPARRPGIVGEKNVSGMPDAAMADLLLSVVEGVATLTINRPERRNAMDGALCDALLSSLTDLSEDGSVGAVILTGAGTDAFSAGGDVKRMDGIARQGFDERLANLRRWGGIAMLLHTMPKVTIAMVNGVAAGAGLSIAAACDLRIAARSARFATSYVKVGRSGDFGGSALLTRLIGAARARELYLLGDIIDAAKAEAYGLVNRVVDDDTLQAETMALARRFADGPRIALAAIKQNLAAAETEPLAAMVEREAFNHARTGDTEDHREAVAAFREKRKPQFTGR